MKVFESAFLNALHMDINQNCKEAVMLRPLFLAE